MPPFRSCVPYPNDLTKVYFFKDKQYVAIQYTPGTTDDKIINGPKTITDYWPALKQAGFDTVDTVLPFPEDPNTAYFFHGEQYARIQINPGEADKLLDGPKTIVDYWPSLKKAGFITVDACYPVPGRPDEAYFFRGTQYVRIRYTPGSTDDTIVYGPSEIFNNWPSLKEADFQTIDCVLQRPDDPELAYFFSNNNYGLIRVIPGTSDDQLVNGPKDVASYWPSLKEAGFY